MCLVTWFTRGSLSTLHSTTTNSCSKVLPTYHNMMKVIVLIAILFNLGSFISIFEDSGAGHSCLQSENRYLCLFFLSLSSLSSATAFIPIFMYPVSGLLKSPEALYNLGARRRYDYNFFEMNSLKCSREAYNISYISYLLKTCVLVCPPTLQRFPLSVINTLVYSQLLHSCLDRLWLHYLRESKKFRAPR